MSQLLHECGTRPLVLVSRPAHSCRARRRDADDRVQPRPDPVLRHGTQPALEADRQDARQLLLNFANAPAYEETVLASMFDIPVGLDRITCPALIMQGTADPLISM
jgi:pimeloyl-ACP methyl ester carboxylesterase